eukprot:6057984-Pleurochrysis_carterae.AAC.1
MDSARAHAWTRHARTHGLGTRARMALARVDAWIRHACTHGLGTRARTDSARVHAWTRHACMHGFGTRARMDSARVRARCDGACVCVPPSMTQTRGVAMNPVDHPMGGGEGKYAPPQPRQRCCRDAAKGAGGFRNRERVRAPALKWMGDGGGMMGFGAVVLPEALQRS